MVLWVELVAQEPKAKMAMLTATMDKSVAMLAVMEEMAMLAEKALTVETVFKQQRLTYMAVMYPL